MAPFLVEADSSKLRVGDKREGGVSFTVTNRLDKKVTGKVAVRPVDDDAIADWFSVGEEQREFAPEGTHRFDVKVTVPVDHEIVAEDPQDPAARAVKFLLVAADVEDLDDATEGPTIAFWVRKIMPVPWIKKFWWVLVVAGVLVIGAAVGISLAIIYSTAGLSESCTKQDDCKAGLVCVTAAEAPTCLGGEGYAPCAENAQCATGYCAKEGDAAEGTCALVPLGGACGPELPCQAGLTCGTQANVCQGQEGYQGCTEAGHCLTGYCAKEGDAAVGTCAPVPLRTLGQACGADAPCLPDLACSTAANVCQGQEGYQGCAEAGHCLTGVCKDGTCGRAAIGDACGETIFCAYPLTCRTNLCRAPDGYEGCSAPAHCESGYCNVGVCGVAPTLGQACSPASGCASPLQCKDAVCRGRSGYKPCEAPGDCVTDFCDLGRDGGTCGTPPGAGQPCHKDSGCRTGLLCWEGVCRGEVGSPCSRSQDCISQVCQSRTCKEPPGLGSTCNPTAGGCSGALLCSADPRGSGHKCRGDRGFRGCSVADHCVTGACRNGACIDPPGLGSACAVGDVCDARLKCFEGTCRGPEAYGPCRRPNQCETLYCKDSVCRKPTRGMVCNPAVGCQSPSECPAAKKKCLSPEGQPCTGNDDCLVGFCDVATKKCKKFVIMICPVGSVWRNGKCERRYQIIRDAILIPGQPVVPIRPGP